MVQEEIKTLFKKYLYGQLKSEEVVRLKALIQNMDDRSLEQNPNCGIPAIFPEKEISKRSILSRKTWKRSFNRKKG